MIYTKGKAGHYMGNTDISVNTLPDANTENTTEHSTIFDDVFRTIAQKMPQLLIPLINEVFHTSYSEEEPFDNCGMNTMKNSEPWSRTPLSGSAATFIIWSASPPKMKRWSSGCLSTTFPLRLSMLLLRSMRSGKLNFRSRAYFTSAITVHFRIFTKRL